MRLRRLWLGHFGNLQDTEIIFDNRPSIYRREDALRSDERGSRSVTLFQPNYRHPTLSLRFFIGLNGSGKSTALRAIGYIFGHLAADIPPAIPFEIEYELGNHEIKITTRLQNGYKNQTLVSNLGVAAFERLFPEDGQPEAEWQEIQSTSLAQAGSGGYIPAHVVGYATGPVSQLYEAMVASTERYVRNTYATDLDTTAITAAVEKGQSDAVRRQMSSLEQNMYMFTDKYNTFCFGADDAMLAALVLFAHNGGAGQVSGLSDDEAQRYSDDRADIVMPLGLDPATPLVSFALHISGLAYQRVRDQWGDVDVARLRELLKKATRCVPIDIPFDIEAIIDGAETQVSHRATLTAGEEVSEEPEDIPPPDFYAIFDLDTIRQRGWPLAYANPLALFEGLYQWQRAKVIRGIRLTLKKATTVKKNEFPDLLTETALSDGEYLYLGRYAILLLTRTAGESLYLFDEPDTHFNDSWKVELVRDIVRLADQPTAQFGSEVIVATHSDLVLTDADPLQVYIFTKDGIRRPLISPLAVDQSDISRVLYNVNRPVGNFVRAYIRQVMLTRNPQEIEKLKERLGPGLYRLHVLERLGEPENDGAN